MKIANIVYTYLAFLLAIPAAFILISWNALPGDKLFFLKKGLENTLLAATLKTPLASRFSVQFTERRFSEANTLLATKSSTVGFDLLTTQTETSKEIILAKNDTESAQNLITKIEEYQDKISVRLQETPTIAPIPPITPNIQKINKFVPDKIEAQKPQEIQENLEKTQQKLEEIKKELEQKLPEKAKEHQEKQDKDDKKDKDKEKPEKENRQRENSDLKKRDEKPED